MLSVCLLAPGSAAWAAGWTPTLPSAPPELVELVTAADGHHALRHLGQHQTRELDLLRRGQQEFPQAYDVHWRLARAACWVAEDVTGEKPHQALALEGWDAARKAAAINPRGLEAQYFTATCVGEFARRAGVLAALQDGLEVRFRDPLLQVQRADDTVDQGGVYAALGRYRYELPWPLRDLAASERLLRRGLVVHPGDLRMEVYLAETLAERGNDKEGQALLRHVLAAAPGTYDTAEELRAQRLAREAAVRVRWKA